MKKFSIVVMAFLIGLPLINVNAARYHKGDSQISFFVKLGTSTSHFNEDYTSENAPSYSLGSTISFFNSANFGFSTGFLFSSYQSNLVLNGESFSTPSVDSEGDDFDLLSAFSGFKEQIQTYFVQVPLSLKYRYEVSDKFGLIPEIGTLLHLSLGSNSNITQGDFSTVGSYPNLGQYTILEGMPGASTYSPRFEEKNYNWNVGVALLAGIQAYYEINKVFLLSAGFSFDYQLSPSKGEGSNALVDYEVTSYKTATCHYNPILTTKDAGSFRKSFVGLKVGIIYKLN